MKRNSHDYRQQKRARVASRSRRGWVITSVFTLISAVIAPLALTSAPAGANPGQGYLLFGSDGGAFAFGNMGFYGSNQNTGQTIVGGTEMPSGNGYWVAGNSGGVYTEPLTAPFYGSIGSINPGQTAQSWLGAPIVGIAAVSAAAGGGGYWIATSNGEVCGFGSATVWAYNGPPANNWCAPRCRLARSMTSSASRAIRQATATGWSAPMVASSVKVPPASMDQHRAKGSP